MCMTRPIAAGYAPRAMAACCRLGSAAAEESAPAGSDTSIGQRFDMVPGFEVYAGEPISREHVRWCSENHPGYDAVTDSYPSDGGQVRCVAPSDQSQ